MHLKKRTRTCLAAGGSLLMATTGLFSAAASASADSTSPVVGYTYVDDNTPPLTPSPGSTATLTARSARSQAHHSRLGASGSARAWRPRGRYR